MDTSRADIASLARHQLEVGYNDRRLDVILGHYAEDAVFTDHALGQTINGIDEIRQYVLVQWGASSSDQVRDLDVIATGEWTVLRFVNAGVNDGPFGGLEPSGRPFEVDFCTVSRWQDGKIVEDHVYYDLYGLMAQLGHIKPLAVST